MILCLYDQSVYQYNDHITLAYLFNLTLQLMYTTVNVQKRQIVFEVPSNIIEK